MGALLAAIDGGAVVQALIWIVIAGIIYWVLDWGIKRIGLPEPFPKIATVLLVLIVVVVVINALLLLAGHPFIKW